MAGKWTKGNWPKGEPKLAAIVEEAIMALIEVQRFAWGYYTGHVTAAGANTLTDADAHWLTNRWDVPYWFMGSYDQHYNVAVRHCIDPVNHIYVWEWNRIAANTVNVLTVHDDWKRVPVVGSPYLITAEKPWIAWMWDEPVKTLATEGAEKDVIQLAANKRGTYQSFYHSIVDNRGTATWPYGHLREGSFGLFGAGKICHFYGGNADKVFETEVAGIPAARGEYYVDYALCRVTIYENSQRPSGVKARYCCGLWPPGYHGQGDELAEHTFNGVEDFYGALWHFSVKGDTDSEGNWAPGLPKLGSASGNPSGLLNPVDTFTELRREIENLCAAGVLWDTIEHKKFTFAKLYNRAMGAGSTWQGDLTRGVGRNIPEGSLLNYGRTWVVCIGEILKCLEQMRWIAIHPLNQDVYDEPFTFSRDDAGGDTDFETAKAEAYAAYLASAWHPYAMVPGSFRFHPGIAGCTVDYGVSGYACYESLTNQGAVYYPGRAVIAFDTMHRRDFSINQQIGFPLAYVHFENMWLTPDFESFNIEVYSSPWTYEDGPAYDSGETLCLFKVGGITSESISVSGPPNSYKDLDFAPFNIPWETDKATLFRFQSTSEDENVIPNPVPDSIVNRTKAILSSSYTEVFFCVQPIFTFTFGVLP